MIKLAIVPNEDLPSSFALTRPIATRNGAVELSQKPFKFHTNLHSTPRRTSAIGIFMLQRNMD